MTDPVTPPAVPPGDKPDYPVGEPGEHPLSVLLFAWMRRPGFARIFLAALTAFCALLTALEFVVERHPKSLMETLPGFYGFWGFIAFGLAVLSGWPLGRLLRRPETYYETDREEGDDDR